MIQMKARILTVDILRPLFVLLIICCHFSVCYLQYDISGFHNFFFKIGNIDFGQLATVGFFVISGWTLAFGGGHLILSRSIESDFLRYIHCCISAI